MENVKGGAREGSGRKSKAEEQKLIEKLSPMEATAHAKLSEAIDEKLKASNVD